MQSSCTFNKDLEEYVFVSQPHLFYGFLEFSLRLDDVGLVSCDFINKTEKLIFIWFYELVSYYVMNSWKFGKRVILAYMGFLNF